MLRTFSVLRKSSTPFGLRRAFSKVSSDGSDPDFASKGKVTTEDRSEVLKFLDDVVKQHDLLLFMKGTPSNPMCGFSAKVSQILKSHKVNFESADVLSNQEIREGIKKFSDWPTIPQLYVNGEFIGGCDIITQMETSGELGEILKPLKEKQDRAKTFK